MRKSHSFGFTKPAHGKSTHSDQLFHALMKNPALFSLSLLAVLSVASIAGVDRGLVMASASHRGAIQNSASATPLNGSDTAPGLLDPNHSLEDLSGGEAPLSNNAPPQPLPMISRELPVYSSGGSLPATNANDSDYGSLWRSSGNMPVWIAYDLSAVPEEQRGIVVVAWYADNYNFNYSLLTNEVRYNCPGIYTIDAHAAPGGIQPPAEADPGWVTLASVSILNPYHSRQHVVNLTDGSTVYNWLRMRVTQVNGSVWNQDVAINLDVHDAHRGVEDDWIFFGDSITAGAMNHIPRGDATFSQIIHGRYPACFPVQQDSGIGGWSTPDGVAAIPGWLAIFPGRYVGISYGTNDAWWVSPSQFYANYETIVKAVLVSGKIPVIPSIPWNRASSAERIPALNAQLDELKAAYPQILSGPDLWTFFQNHQDLISTDNIHPTEEGYAAYRRQWAEAMLFSVYSSVREEYLRKWEEQGGRSR
jgi:lysophospholipase L1-like esterase